LYWHLEILAQGLLISRRWRQFGFWVPIVLFYVVGEAMAFNVLPSQYEIENKYFTRTLLDSKLKTSYIFFIIIRDGLA